MPRIAIGIAQILYRPAFFLNQNDLLLEPIDTTSISKLSFPGSIRLKTELKTEYITWIRKKIIAIVTEAISLHIRVLVFPEYSIPALILRDIVNAIAQTNLLVVAGTHIITRDSINLPAGYPEARTIIGCALCPILSSEGVKDYTIKTHKAAEEIGNLVVPKALQDNYFSYPDFNLHIKICIDAITLDGTFKATNKDILVIPSLSKKTEPFEALSTLSRFNKIPTLYANGAIYGGSSITGAYSKDDAHWFVDHNSLSSKALPKNTEGLVVVDVDISNMQHGVGSVDIIPPISVNRVYNLFYRGDETQKKAMEKIDFFLDNFPDGKECIPQTPDYLFSLKLRTLKYDDDNRLLNEEKARDYLRYISINSPTFSQLNHDHVNKALQRLASNISQSSTDPEFMNSLAILAGYLNSSKSGTTIDLFNDETLFVGRDEEISSIGEFFDSEVSTLFIHGIRGIGKTKLLSRIRNTVLPDPTPWIIKKLTIDRGIGFDLIIDQFEYSLGLTYIEKKSLTPSELAHKMFEQISAFSPFVYLIEDINYCTELSGEFSDERLKEFICTFISISMKSKNIKLILTSNRNVPEIRKLSNRILQVSRLSNAAIRHIISYCYRKITGSIKSLTIKDSTIEFIYGNPLAAILAAHLIGSDKLDEFESKGEVFKRFQEQQIKNLIGDIDLRNDEQQIMFIISASKGSVPTTFFNQHYPFLIPHIERLVDRLLLERNGGLLYIHPIFREAYYERMSIRDRYKYHEIFANYYESSLEDPEIDQNDPSILSNAIYHFAGSMQTKKLQQYRLRYIDEIKPIADQLYRDKNYTDAVKYYQMIYDTCGVRHDVLIKMAQCYFYCNDLKSSEYYFGLATEANPRGAYLWANYSITLSSKRIHQDRAMELADKAESIYRQYGNSFKWELARIKFAQGKAIRNTNPLQAADLYEEACEYDNTNVYYHCMYAKTLFEIGQKPYALERLQKAEAIDSRDPLVIRFKEIFNANCDVLSDLELLDDNLID